MGVKKIFKRDYFRKLRGEYSSGLSSLGEMINYPAHIIGNIENGTENDIRVISEMFFLFSRRFGIAYYDLMLMEAKFQLETANIITADDNSENTVSFAELLKMIRTQQDISQGKLADECGVSKNLVSQWERSISLPALDMLSRICYILKLPDGFFDAAIKKSRKELSEERKRKEQKNEKADNL